jgi:hypothetical protein
MAELHVVSLRTGNAARSVMGGVLLAEHSHQAAAVLRHGRDSTD